VRLTPFITPRAVCLLMTSNSEIVRMNMAPTANGKAAVVLSSHSVEPKGNDHNVHSKALFLMAVNCSIALVFFSPSLNTPYRTEQNTFTS